MRRSKSADERNNQEMKKLFSEGGYKALRDYAKTTAEKLFTDPCAAYKTVKEMEAGFYAECLRRAEVEDEKKEVVIKDGQSIEADEAKDIIGQYGVESVIADGAIVDPEAIEEDIEDGDCFEVVINYGHGVQLHLIGSSRCVITLKNLKGQCGEIVEDGKLAQAQWYAVWKK